MNNTRADKEKEVNPKKKTPLIIAIVVVVVAAIVLALVFGNPTGSADPSPTEAESAGQPDPADETASPEDGDETSTEGAFTTGETPSGDASADGDAAAPPAKIEVETPDPSSVSEQSTATPASSDVFENADAHAGEMVSIKGTADGAATHNEGMLELVLVTQDGYYALISIPDTNSQYNIAAGDSLEVTGIVTTSVEIQTANGLLFTGPLIAAQTIDT